MLNVENFYKNEEFNTVLRERDEALKRVKELEERISFLESQLSKVSGQLLNTSKALSEEAEKFKPLAHNARGAGRKKDPLVDIKKNRFKMMYLDNVSREEICKRLGISKSTYYRFRKECCTENGTGENL